MNLWVALQLERENYSLGRAATEKQRPELRCLRTPAATRKRKSKFVQALTQ